MSSSTEEKRTYLGVAVAFLGLAVALGITMDSWVTAVPFAAIAVTFLALGTERSKRAGSTGSRSDDDAD